MFGPKKIAITGATGFVGQMVLDECARQGQQVSALTRSEKNPREGVQWVAGDLNNKDALRELVRGAEAVIHIAGIVNAPDPAKFEEGNVTGTLNLIEACVATGAPRFVFISSLSAREPQLSAYGASKHRAEKLVMASGLDWTIVRPPAIYGPRDSEILELFRFAKWGVVPMPPKDGRTSLIHVEDLARLLLACLPSSEDVTGQIFEPDDGRKSGWAHGEWARLIGKAVGRRPWVPHLSRGMLGAMSGFDRLVNQSKATLTKDRVSYMVHPNWVVSKDKAVPSSIWTPQIDSEQGLQLTAEWYRENKWL